MSSHLKRFFPATAVLWGLLASPCLLPTISAQQVRLPAAAQQGILLLRNGQVLEGTIVQSGDRYHVAVDGGRITVRATDVDFSCRSLREAYQRKRARLRLGSAADHAELARWCQQVGLIDCAVRELADAKAIDPTHPAIGLVQRRVEMMLRPPPPANRPGKPVEDPVSPDDLDRMVRGMPPGTVEDFTQTIQPLLINNCSAAECHGAQSRNPFRLLRPHPGGFPTRRLTQRNLHAALQSIDWDDPPASPLLTAPTRPHTCATAPIFTDQQFAQYKQIVDWVYQVTQAPQPQQDVATVSHHASDDPLPGGRPALFTSPAVSGEGSVPSSDQEGQVSANQPADDPPIEAGTAPPSGGLKTADRPQSSDQDVRLPQFVPADPFDPEIFNRRFFPSTPRPDRS